MEVVHIASQAIQIGSEIRQRCCWCGDALIEQDLAYVAVQAEHADKPYPVWPVGGLVAQDSNATYVVPWNEGDELPITACANVPSTAEGA